MTAKIAATRPQPAAPALPAIAESPAALGYRMPAEWEPQRATWLAWPHNRSDWPGKFEPIPYVYAEIVRHLARAARVELIVNDGAAEARARTILTHANVLPESGAAHRLSPVAHQSWMAARLRPDLCERQDGQSCADQLEVQRLGQVQELASSITRFRKRSPGCAAARLLRPRSRRDAMPRRWQMVLEGGSIDVNGRGLLLTTEECLLSPVQQRNPGMTREQIEAALGRMLGVKKVLWLERGIVGDDTHGHVDDIARFVGPRTVLAASEADPADENHAILKENLKRLKKMTDTAGKALEVIPLPMPAPVVFKGQRVPASYANFLHLQPDSSGANL